MSSDLNSIFVDNGVYKLKTFNDSESIFVSESVAGNDIGKLVMFDKINDRVYRRTSVAYFLHTSSNGDMKGLFTCRDNYDMIGLVGVNFRFNNLKKYLIDCKIM